MKCNKLEILQLSKIIKFPNMGAESSISVKPPLYLKKRYKAKTLRIYAYTQLPLFLLFSLFCIVTKALPLEKSFDFFLLCLKAVNRNSAEDNYIQAFTCAKTNGWLPRKIVCPHIVLTSDCHNPKSVWLELYYPTDESLL